MASAALAALSPPAAAQSMCRVPTPLEQVGWFASLWMQLPLVLLAVLYGIGVCRLWRRGWGRGVGRGAVVCFGAGTGLLLLVTAGPLRALGAWSLAAHMAQHMVLLALVPPLLLAGRPLAVVACALPAAWSRRLHRVLHPLQRWLGDALAPATIAHCAAMWLWHTPGGLQRALEGEVLHWTMHTSFLVAGLWFWGALWRRIRDPVAGAVPGLVALVVVMMQMGFIGALLTFASRPLYAVYVLRAPELGLAPLADQQLAGLLMWVPSCLPYLAGAAWLLWRGFGRLERSRRPTGAVRR